MVIGLNEIPYLRQFPNDGRIIPLMNYFDGTRWHSYRPEEPGRALDLHVVEFVSGMYLALDPQHESDLELPLLTFLFQRKPIRATFKAFEPLYNDLENALAVLHKQFVLFRHYAANADLTYGTIVSTELEYALFNHRSAYDLINRLIIAFLRQHHLLKNEPPDSFRKVAQRTIDETKAGYGFSDQVAEFYAAKKDRFLVLREARDAIVHHGKSPGFVFKLPHGFGINGNSLVGSELKRGNLWANLKPNENDLGSCLALLALLTKDLFDVLADVTGALTESIADLPVETAPGYRVFARSQLSTHRILIPTYLDEPWRMDAGSTHHTLS